VIILFPLLFLNWTFALRGVRERDAKYYTGESFVCRDGSKTVPGSYVNDDYCDCETDGSDEPGTSACVRGHFFCPNRGYKSVTISSSRVHDGFCDCCDGSDEDGLIVCTNTCEAQGKIAKQGVLKHVEDMEKGAAIRDEWIKEAEQTKLKQNDELKRLEQQSSELNSQITAAQMKVDEEEEKEKQERERREAEIKANETIPIPVPTEVPTEAPTEASPSPTDVPTPVDTPNANNDAAPTTTPDQASSFPYPAEYAAPSSQQSSSSEQTISPPSSPDSSMQESEDNEEGGMAFPYPEEYAPKSPQAPSMQDDDVDDEENKEKEKEKEKDTYVSEAASRARDELNSLRSDKLKLEKQLEDIRALQAHDYGQDSEYLKLQGQCFQHTLRQYTYEFCPYDRADQKEGSSSTSLGRWKGWDNSAPVSTMLFTEGQRCWQGPARSLSVQVECGVSNSILSVEEPNKCVYEMKFTSPAACSRAHAQILSLNLNRQFEEDDDEDQDH